jgi:hypothetical protein
LSFGILPERFYDKSAKLAALGPVDAFGQAHAIVGDSDPTSVAV